MPSLLSPFVFEAFPNDDWEAATRSELKEAIISIHKLSEDGFWRVDTLLEKEEALRKGLSGWSCFGFCYEERVNEAKKATKELFDEFQGLAIPNRALINGSPIAWTCAQTHAVLSLHFGANHSRQKFVTIKRWIKEFCDGKVDSGVLANDPTEDWATLFREDWRAPVWLRAWGSKHFAHNPAAWDRLDQQTALQRLPKDETEKLLDGISDWFWTAIECALEGLGRLASISLASQGAAVNSSSSEGQIGGKAQAKQGVEPQIPVYDTDLSKGVREGATVESLYAQLKRIRRLYREKGWPPSQIRQLTNQEMVIAWEWIDRIDDASRKSDFIRISDWDDGDGFIFRQIATLYEYAPHLSKKPTWSTVRDWRKAFRGHLRYRTPDGRKPRS